jgi:hypothetical protein
MLGASTQIRARPDLTARDVDGEAVLLISGRSACRYPTCREEGTMEDRRESTSQDGESRRDAMRKMAYAAPLVLSLAAAPAFASSGSCGHPHKGSKSHHNSTTQSLNNG